MHRLIIVIFGILLLGGCAHRLDYNRLYAQLKTGDCQAVARQLDENFDAYGENDRLLYLLDSAVVHLQCRNFETAQEKFHAAERLAEMLWTESLSRQAASLVANDTLLKYQGEDYERALINMMSAMGYLRSQQFDDALVECRRLDSLLNLLNDKYEKKNVYKEDAFGRYLSGILHEADNSPDDAFIDYRKALLAYRDYETHYDTPPPPTLVEDLQRIAAAVDRSEDIAGLTPGGDTPRGLPLADTRPLGKVIFLQLSGRAPAKTQGQIVVPTRSGPVSIAYPRLLLLPPACTYHRVALFSETDHVEAQLHLAEDIGRIALKNLEDKKVRIMAKTMARTVAKQVVIDSIAKNRDKNTERLLKTALNIANLFIERADTRSWRTLPGQIYMARLFLPPGKYAIETAACDRQPRKLENILVQAGQTHYIVYDDRFAPTVIDE